MEDAEEFQISTALRDFLKIEKELLYAPCGSVPRDMTTRQYRKEFLGIDMDKDVPGADIPMSKKQCCMIVKPPEYYFMNDKGDWFIKCGNKWYQGNETGVMPMLTICSGQRNEEESYVVLVPTFGDVVMTLFFNLSNSKALYSVGPVHTHYDILDVNDIPDSLLDVIRRS